MIKSALLNTVSFRGECSFLDPKKKLYLQFMNSLSVTYITQKLHIYLSHYYMCKRLYRV